MLDVDEYICKQSPVNAEILYTLRELVLNSAPFIKESIKYKTPFYSIKKDLCYLLVSKEKVHLAFINGCLLGSGKEVLETKKRKYIRSISFLTVPEINKILLST